MIKTSSEGTTFGPILRQQMQESAKSHLESMKGHVVDPSVVTEIQEKAASESVVVPDTSVHESDERAAEAYAARVEETAPILDQTAIRKW